MSGNSHLHVVLALVTVLAGCATTGVRVEDVILTKQTPKMVQREENAAMRDRASGYGTPAELVLPAGNREQVYVHWSAGPVTQVKLEYRQLNLPAKIQQQMCNPGKKNWHDFFVQGDDYSKGGVITAWRVTLWQDDRLLAEKKSVLW